METFVNYIFGIIFILIGAGNVFMVLKYYEEGRYYAVGVHVMLTIYVAIYLFKSSMET